MLFSGALKQYIMVVSDAISPQGAGVKMSKVKTRRYSFSAIAVLMPCISICLGISTSIGFSTVNSTCISTCVGVGIGISIGTCVLGGCARKTETGEQKSGQAATGSEGATETETKSEFKATQAQAPTPTLTSSLEKYSLQFFGDETPKYFTVTRDGGAATTCDIEEAWDENSNIKLAKLAGAGDVFVIVQSEQDNNHYVYRFFNCAGDLKEEVTIDNGYLPLEFVTPEEGGDKVIKAYDWWDKDAGARALAPEVFLVWNGGKLQFDQKRMRALKPSREEIESAVQSFKVDALAKDGRWPSVEFEDYLLGLIYSGNQAEAKRFLGRCWPRSRPGKEKFWSVLLGRVKDSRYYSEVQRINRA